MGMGGYCTLGSTAKGACCAIEPTSAYDAMADSGCALQRLSLMEEDAQLSACCVFDANRMWPLSREGILLYFTIL